MFVDFIVGTRPNFVKVASLLHSFEYNGNPFKYRLIHTGQHYSQELSDIFLSELNIPEPDFFLNSGSGSQAEQTSAIMLGYEKILIKEKPTICVVVGDVTSSLACALTAKKMNIKIAHVEAGLRSYDWEMPEEVNRVIIDSISDYFFTTTPEAGLKLQNSGISFEKIFFVGNTMIDTLMKYSGYFRKPEIWHKIGLSKKNYFVLTLHRPSNVDEASYLQNILHEILNHSQNIPIIFPVHPRTQKMIQNIEVDNRNLYPIKPLSYLEFNFLVKNSLGVITDSGGISEETTIQNVPCLSLRANTERPETVTLGTNELLGNDPKNIGPAINRILQKKWKKAAIPELWDGQAGKRIIKQLADLMN